jgi:hypothetical protein
VAEFVDRSTRLVAIAVTGRHVGPLTTREIFAIETARGTRHVVLVIAGPASRHVENFRVGNVVGFVYNQYRKRNRHRYHCLESGLAMTTKRSCYGRRRGTVPCTRPAAHAHKLPGAGGAGRDAWPWESDSSPGDRCNGEQMILRTESVTAP